MTFDSHYQGSKVALLRERAWRSRLQIQFVFPPPKDTFFNPKGSASLNKWNGVRLEATTLFSVGPLRRPVAGCMPISWAVHRRRTSRRLPVSLPSPVRTTIGTFWTTTSVGILTLKTWERYACTLDSSLCVTCVVYQQSLHYWELRYLLLPKQCPTLPPLCTSHEQRRREEELLISNFVRFLEFLNRIKKGLGSAKISRFSQSSMQTLVSTLVYTSIHFNHDSLHFHFPKYLGIFNLWKSGHYLSGHS